MLSIGDHNLVQVRSVRAAEWREYRDIRLAALRESPSAFASSYAREAAFGDDTWQARTRASQDGKSSSIVIASDRRGRWVGLVSGYRPGEGVDAELVSLWVDPAARNHGLGRLLVDAVVSWAAAHRDRTIGLWVNDRNRSAVDLYARARFAPTGESQPLPSDPRLTEIRMIRRLDGTGLRCASPSPT
jgi:ribosomal protein S18 acetylase RimI-like enzyme